MLYPYDEAYIETRRILTGVTEPATPYRALTTWIAEQDGGTNVLNVVYWMWAKSRPCLTVVMEREEDITRLTGGEARKRDVHLCILSRFNEILREQRNTKIQTENIFIIVSAFAPGARSEANHRVSQEAIFQFQSNLAEPSIWLMQPRFTNLRVFFHTDAQLAASEHSPVRAAIAERYKPIVEPFDEFGYVREDPIVPVYDSWERFQRIYKGNWQGYDRDNP